MIDAHVHVWALEPDRFPWQPTLPHIPVPDTAATAEDLLTEMDRATVSHAVLVQPSVYGWANDYLCSCLERFPNRFAGVCLVDPRAEHSGEALRYWCAQRGCRGLRINIIAEASPDWLLGRPQEQLWVAAADLGISVSMQLLPAHAPLLAELARRRPEVTFVADYLGTLAYRDETGIAAVKLLAERPNVWFKVLVTGSDSHEAYPFRDLWPLYECAVDSFGPNRLVFGTDFPYVRAAMPYPRAMQWLEELPFLDERSRLAIADSNARRLWQIDEG